MLSSVGMVNATTPPADYTKNTTNQCATPTVTINLAGGPGESYNQTTINVAQGACVAIDFVNMDSASAHTFTIDGDSANNITVFNIYLAAKGDTATVNFQAPNADITIPFYCAVPGHATAGMKGNMVVGTATSKTGGSTPGFEVVSLFFGLFVATGLVATYRRRKN